VFKSGRSAGYALVITLVVTAAALLAVAARASVVTVQKNAGLVHPRLTPAERAAIAIRSIDATSDQSLGLIVTVTFAGDIERYGGVGGLAHSDVALAVTSQALRPRAIGLVDSGGGFSRTRVPVIGHGDGQLTSRPGTVDLFNAEPVLRAGTPAQANVVRYGNHIIFYVPAAGLGAGATVKLKVLANGPRPPSGPTRPDPRPDPPPPRSSRQGCRG